jgi:hypothetical protein
MEAATMRKQGRARRLWWFAIHAMLVVGGLAFALFVARFVAVDRCLDSGGRWNYEVVECER